MPKPPDTNPQPRSPAPQHDPVFIWPTPNKEDYLFWVEKNGDLPKNKEFTYGDPHPDTGRYPNHKLVFVSPQTTDKWSRWFYASDRINEDEYNWEFTDADLGGAKFPAVRRTYLTKRVDFNPTSPTQGAAMPNVPAGLFGTGSGSPSVVSTYVLADRQQTRTGENEFDSLYVTEVLTYIRRETMTQNDFDEALGGNLRTVQTLYYRGESVSGGGTAQVEKLTFSGGVTVGVAASKALTITDNPSDSETVVINGTTFTFKTTAGASPDVQIGTDVAATQAELVSVVNAAGTGGTLSGFVANVATYTHGTIGTGGNAIAISETMAGASNAWAGGATFLSGGVNSGAGNITVTFTAATGLAGSPVSVVVPVDEGDSLSDIANRVAVALADSGVIYAKALPSTSGATVSLTYRIKEADSPSDSLAATVGSTGLSAVGSSVEGVAASDTIENLFADSSNSFWGLQGDFTEREGNQLTVNWFAVSSKQIVPSDFVLKGRSYLTVENFTWPSVLNSIKVDVWPRNEGGADMYTRPYFSKESYRGPCSALVQETFFTKPPPVSAPKVMMPLPIDLATPFFSLNIAPCLHGALNISITSGTEHPIYDYTGGVYSYPATTPTSWPSSIVASDEVRPFRGGYMRTKVTIYPPGY